MIFSEMSGKALLDLLHEITVILPRRIPIASGVLYNHIIS
jgi:hypothetical protein